MASSKKAKQPIKNHVRPLSVEEVLLKAGRPLTFSALAKLLGLRGGNKKKLGQELQRSLRSKAILKDDHQRYLLPSPASRKKLEAHKAKKDSSSFKTKWHKPRSAQRDSVREDEFRTNRIVGSFVDRNSDFAIKPRKNPKFSLPFEHDQTRLKSGDIIVVRPLQSKKTMTSQTLMFEKKLPHISDPLLDFEILKSEFNLPHPFEAAELDEAELAASRTDLAQERIDLQHLPFCTIDGADAKDFDDAVYISDEHLFVAIADVASFVPEGSLLDRTALERGNSYYYPSLVIPMLPERLSNDLCSLRPHEVRRVLVAKISRSGLLKGDYSRTELFPATIKSRARLTYPDVETYLNGVSTADVSHELKLSLNGLHEFTRTLRANRMKDRSLNLQGLEKKAILDTRLDVIDLMVRRQSISEQLIEECMLAANLAVADYFLRNNLPCVWRCHPNPLPDKLSELAAMLERFGIRCNDEFMAGNKEAIMAMLNEAMKKPEKEILAPLFLRAMSQALYTTKNEGHYGLGFEAYVHFTSPIRRYADLWIHRALYRHEFESLPPKGQSSDGLDSICEHISRTERIAQKSEYDMYDLKAARFMKSYIGKTYEGRIVRCGKFGVAVEIKEWPAIVYVDRSKFLDKDVRYDSSREQWLPTSKHSRMRVKKLGRPMTVLITDALIPEARIWGREV